MRKLGLLSMVFAALLLVSGCGQKMKQENEQLKAQVTTLTQENTNLKSQVTALQKESEDAKAQVASLTAELDATKKQMEAKAKPAAKNGKNSKKKKK